MKLFKQQKGLSQMTLIIISLIVLIILMTLVAGWYGKGETAITNFFNIFG